MRLQPTLDALKEEPGTCCLTLGEMEERLVSINNLTTLEAANENLIKENNELKEKTEMTEMHSRKFNLHVFGLKGDVRKSDPIAFITNFFMEVFRESSHVS